MRSFVQKLLNQGRSLFFSLKNKLSGLAKQNNNHSLFKKQNSFDKQTVFDTKKSRFPSWKQLTCLKFVLSQKEKAILLVCLGLIIIGLSGWGTGFYLNHRELTARVGGEYTEGLVGSPHFLNPLLAQYNAVDQDMSSLIFSGLLKYNENLELVPDIASSYEVDGEEKLYTFHLRKDVAWHEPKGIELEKKYLNADDIIFTIQSIQDPNFKSPLFISFKDVGVEKIDDYTVRFILNEPYTPFFGLLTTGILPQELWQDVPPMSANLAELNQKPVGTGPFQFQSLVKDKLGRIKSYNLVRNKNYYNQPPYLQKITFKFFSDTDQAFTALQNAEIEGLSYFSLQTKNKLYNEKSLEQHSLLLPQYTAVFFNQSKNELLKKLKFRQALAQAVNRSQIIDEVLDGSGQVVETPILPGLIGYNPDLKKLEYDPLSAQKLLDELEWLKDEETNFRKKGDQDVAVTLTTLDLPERIKTAEIIKEYWEAIGVKTEIIASSAQNIQAEVIKERNYEALLHGQMVGADPDPFAFWHSSQTEDPGRNLAIFSNTDADKLIEEARQTTDLVIRKEKYQKFQDVIAEDLPAIFLYDPYYSYLLPKKIKGFDLDKVYYPSDRFTNIEKWYIKEKFSWK